LGVERWGGGTGGNGLAEDVSEAERAQAKRGTGEEVAAGDRERIKSFHLMTNSRS
jgi:hypothetical protein